MDLLGVGPLEFFFVLIIIFLVLGPNDMAKTGRKVGRFLSAVRRSEFWNGVTKVTREMRDLPTNLMREAELEDVDKELRSISREFRFDSLKELDQETQLDNELSDQGQEIAAAQGDDSVSQPRDIGDIKREQADA